MEPTEKQQKRIDQIINVALKIFRKEGYKATTMRAIAKKLGMNQGSLYYYFNSKADILVEIHRRMMNMVIEQQKEFENLQLSSEQKLAKVIERILFIQGNYRDYAYIFLREFSSLPPAYLKKVREAADDYRKILEKIIVEGIEKKRVKKLNPKIISFALLGMCNWMAFWYNKRGPVSLPEITETFSTIFLDGVLERSASK